MPVWSDFFRLFSYASEKDPLSARKDPKQFGTAGISQPEALGADFANAMGAEPRSFRQTHDMIDTTSLSNRSMRYKEYERLRNVPEIETAMTVISDEACVAGDTKVATPFGFFTIKELAETKADERFLVYCYDFSKQDYALGWAYAPRLVKKEETVTIILDNGGKFTVTVDHQVLKRDGNWIAAGELKYGDELMPFYRKQPNKNLNKLRHNQFPRIFTFNRGWIHEKQFTDEWKLGESTEQYEKLNKAVRLVGSGLKIKEIVQVIKHDWNTVVNRVEKGGFTLKEIRFLSKSKDKRKVVGVHKDIEQDVYDISVEEHKCFATEDVILHNCQKDEEGNVFKIITKNEEVKSELQFVLLNKKMLNLNRNSWIHFKNLCISGDVFLETVINPDNPKEGIYKIASLPCETMYRIETVKGRVIEFQQSKEGPDYQAISRGSIDELDDSELSQSTAIRFSPEQIIHMRIGDDRKTFYPYGQSLIEPARAPAHNLRLMEDAMVVYRLTRAPERRVFYIDVGQLPPFKAEAFMDRIKDQFRKRKIANNRGGAGANGVEERWQPPSPDEDYWIPVRPNGQTKIETLPGAENLGEIDDAIYFRNKLLVALNFPKNYFNNEDTNATRISLSAQDVKFARMIERLQSSFEDGILEIAERHLKLRGFPEESYKDLKIKMTPPSDWRELSRAEVFSARYTNAGSLKGSQIMSDYDIYIDILKIPPDKAEEMIARLKIQKLEDLKLQVLAQNPQLLGVGIPGDEEENKQELGSEAGGPSMMPEPGAMPGQEQPEMPGMPQQPEEGEAPEGQDQQFAKTSANAIPEPSEEDVKKYDMEIKNYAYEQDQESIDYSVGD